MLNQRHDLQLHFFERHCRRSRPLRFVVVDDLGVGRGAVLHGEGLLRREAEVLNFSREIDENVAVRARLGDQMSPATLPLLSRRFS